MNQLITGNSNKNTPVLRDRRRKFLRKIPVNKLIREFKKAFEKKENIETPENKIRMKDVVQVFYEIKGQMENNLKDGIFHHVLDFDIDKINDYMYWQYKIKIKNAMISFVALDDVFDPHDTVFGSLTPQLIIDYLHEQFFKGNVAISRFNEVVEGVKPTLPKKLPKKYLLDEMMKETQKLMVPNSKKRSTFDPRNEVFDSWIIGNALRNIKRIQLNQKATAHIEFMVFSMPDDGWISIYPYLRLGIGVKFLLEKKEVNFYSQLSGKKFINFYKNFIQEMEMAIKNWNWMVKGGNNQRSKIKNKPGKYYVTGGG
ncbi:MAG: hypothetical protein ACOCT9_02120, partial [archaeon]